MLRRTKNTILYVILMVVGSLISSCRPSPQYPEALLVADSLTQCNADSAVRLLQELAPTLSQAKEPVRRYHQLLTIKARDKAFITHTSDSLVLTLLRYYQEEGDPRLLPEACYYAGRVTRDLGDAPQALDYFHQALDAMQSSDYQSRMQGQEERTLKLQGNIHAQMGYLFRRQHLYDEAIKAFEQAYRVDSLNRDTTGMIFDIQDIGKIYYLKSKTLQALSYYEKAEQLSLIHNDSIMLFEIASNIACLYDFIGDYEIALAYFNKYPIQLTQQNNSSIYFTQADLLSHLGRKDEAEKIFLHLLSYGDIYIQSNANLWLGNYKSTKGDGKEAIKYIKNYVLFQDSLNNLKNDESVVLSQSLYNYHLREKEISELKLEESMLEARSWMYIALAAIATVLLYIEHARRRKIKRQNELLQGIIDASKKNAEIKKTLAQTALEGLNNHELFIYVKKQSEERCQLSAKDWTAIEALLSEYFPDFIPKLRGTHTYNETEWKLSLLLKMGFSWAEIAILIGRSYTAVYTSQNRLLKKVFPQGSSYNSWADFISVL